MLKKLEKSHNVGTNISKNNESELQLSFFNLDHPKLEELKEDLISLNIDELTPIEALIKLNEIKRMKKYNVNKDTNTLIEKWTDYYNTSGKDIYGK